MNERSRENSHWLDDEEFGYRGILGLITPSVALTTEHEWCRMLPRGTAFVTTRIYLHDVTLEGLARMGRYVDDAILMMKSAQVDAVCYGCTAGSMSRGIEYDEALIDQIQKETGKPATTMAQSVIQAMRHLGMKRVGVVTPYTDIVNRTVQKFLEDNGFQVLAIEGRQLLNSMDIRVLPPSAAEQMVREMNRHVPDCDGLFISCGNFRAIEVLSGLEESLKKPVISSNQAMLWSGLRLLGVKDPIYGFGSLLERG